MRPEIVPQVTHPTDRPDDPVDPNRTQPDKTLRGQPVAGEFFVK
jgi:hypothetical protein